MRVRMLEAPGVAEKINRDSIPVMVNASDDGFPRGIPALKFWEDDYKFDPWARMTYGHFMLIDGKGEQTWGASGCQCHEVMVYKDPYRFGEKHFDQGIKLFQRASRLRDRAKNSESARLSLAKIKNDTAAALRGRYVCMSDTRLHTGRLLVNWGGAPWKKVLSLIVPRKPGDIDPLGPNMRNAALHRVGEFLCNDEPFKEDATRHLAVIYALSSQEDAMKMLAKSKAGKVKISEVPLPVSLRKKAAFAIGQITGQNWSADASDLLETASAWWLKHQGDPEYAVKPELEGRFGLGPLRVPSD